MQASCKMDFRNEKLKISLIIYHRAEFLPFVKV